MSEPLPPPLPGQSVVPPLPTTPGAASLWRESLAEHGDTENNVQGLGGWLFLFGAGRVIAVFTWLAALQRDLRLFGRPGVWTALTTPGSESYQAYWATIIVYETSGNAVWLLFSLLLVVLFFARWKIFRPLIIFYLFATTVFLWGDHFLAGQLTTIHDQQRIQGLASSIAVTVSMIIWIPYFLVSDRVKRTFVR